MGKLSFVTMTFGVLLSSVLGLVGCGSGDSNSSADSENVGSAQIELKSVPATGVTCIGVTVVVGTQTIKKFLTVTANSATTSLSLGQLPLGNATVSGNAYALACTDATVTGGTAQANWVADPVMARLQEGVITIAPLTFRRVNAVMASANFVDNVKSVEAGSGISYAVMADGTVKYWGLPEGTLFTQPLPTTPVALPVSITGVASVSASPFDNFSCALKTDGTVWCWGFNFYGQLGNGTTTDSLTPVKVTGLSSVTTLSVGGNHVCAGSETTNHTWCWGLNNEGQLGNGTFTNSSLPVEVFVGRPQKLALGAQSTCVLGAAGGVSCWGNNDYGQLGNGTTITKPTASASGNNTVTDIASGNFHVCVLKVNGAVACWGTNGDGQLGNGSTTSSSLAVPVSGLSGVASIALGSDFSCALTQGAQVFCWGDNFTGEDGNGTAVDLLSPGTTPILSNALAISAGNQHACALLDGQTLQCWGDNTYGQLGTGDYVTVYTPKVSALQ